MSDLAELLERVKAASGPDRDLECDLVEAFISASEAGTHFNFDLASYRYTASIDAMLALIERELPGQCMNLVRQDGRWYCTFTEGRDHYWREKSPPIGGATLPLALCAAFLAAKIAQATP